MSQAAFLKKVQISADAGATWHPLPATSPSLEIGGDLLDDTTLINNAGAHHRMYGLTDWSASCDSNLVVMTGNAGTDTASGAKALDLLRAAKLGKTGVKFRYLPTGNVDSTGLVGDVLVETYSFAGEVNGLETVAISLQANGPLAAAA